MKNRFWCILLILCVSVICGCGKEKSVESDGGFKIYYLNKSENKLMSVGYTLKNDETDKAVEEVADRLSKVSKKINYINALPEGVKIKGYEINDNTLSMSFSMEYLTMKKSREIMCRAAIVLTMTQIKGIDYVSFSVENEPLKNSTGENIGPMKAADFVDSAGSSINSYQNVEITLFFGNSGGDKLVEQKFSKIYSENVSMERYIVDSLIKGPGDSEMTRTVSEQTKVISVTTKDGICYVNLGGTFLSDTLDVTDEVEIYSIVNSLCELTNVSKVQFSIDGDTNVKLHGKFDLNKTFSRNLDICEQQD